MDFDIGDEAGGSHCGARDGSRQSLAQFRLKGRTGITRCQARGLPQGQRHGPSYGGAGTSRFAVELDGPSGDGESDQSGQDAYPAACYARDDVPIHRSRGDADRRKLDGILDVAPIRQGFLLAGQL